jgi:hypothetical protein
LNTDGIGHDQRSDTGRRRESDREDLMREAVAMPERAELRVPGFDELVTIGFRANRAMSIFIGQDLVYQFDPAGRLRRAFANGFLYRSQAVTLAKLQRVRTETKTLLQRSDLNNSELAEFQTGMKARLSELTAAIGADRIQVLRSVPPNTDHRPRLYSSISQVLAASPWLSTEIRMR